MARFRCTSTIEQPAFTALNFNWTLATQPGDTASQAQADACRGLLIPCLDAPLMKASMKFFRHALLTEMPCLLERQKHEKE